MEGYYYLLAKHRAAVTPINPKNGADVGQVSYDTVLILMMEFSRVDRLNEGCGGVGSMRFLGTATHAKDRAKKDPLC
jgi:hypothetical protein